MRNPRSIASIHALPILANLVVVAVIVRLAGRNVANAANAADAARTHTIGRNAEPIVASSIVAALGVQRAHEGSERVVRAALGVVANLALRALLVSVAPIATASSNA
jgi:hypothetical protein